MSSHFAYCSVNCLAHHYHRHQFIPSLLKRSAAYYIHLGPGLDWKINSITHLYYIYDRCFPCFISCTIALPSSRPFPCHCTYICFSAHVYFATTLLTYFPDRTLLPTVHSNFPDRLGTLWLYSCFTTQNQQTSTYSTYTFLSLSLAEQFFTFIYMRRALLFMTVGPLYLFFISLYRYSSHARLRMGIRWIHLDI